MPIRRVPLKARRLLPGLPHAPDAPSSAIRPRVAAARANRPTRRKPAAPKRTGKPKAVAATSNHPSSDANVREDSLRNPLFYGFRHFRMLKSADSTFTASIIPSRWMDCDGPIRIRALPPVEFPECASRDNSVLFPYHRAGIYLQTLPVPFPWRCNNVLRQSVIFPFD